jgi:hypothetical protein
MGQLATQHTCHAEQLQAAGLSNNVSVERERFAFFRNFPIVFPGPDAG